MNIFPMTDAERIELKELKMLKKKQRRSPAHKNYTQTKGGHDIQARHARHNKYLSSLQSHDLCLCLSPMGSVTRQMNHNNTFYPLFLVFSHIPLREASTRPNRCVALVKCECELAWGWHPQPWRFTNNSLGLSHAPSLSVCLFACLPV